MFVDSLENLENFQPKRVDRDEFSFGCFISAVRLGAFPGPSRDWRDETASFFPLVSG